MPSMPKVVDCYLKPGKVLEENFPIVKKDEQERSRLKICFKKGNPSVRKKNQ